MPGTKRSSTEAGVSDSPKSKRSPKAAKTDKSKTAKEKGSAKSSSKNGKGGIKATMTSNEFVSKALPLHVNITHTPPVIPEEDDKVPASSADPGFIGSSALIPVEFKTGSYGWKGHKRVTIEVENPEGGDKEKVQVMININATVLGSKSKSNKTDQAEEDVEDAEVAENEDSVDEAANTAEE